MLQEFHDGPRRDDNDFHLVSKIFFYRQGKTAWNHESWFDDMLNSNFNIANQRESTGEVITPTVGDGVNESLPVVMSDKDPSERKRKRAIGDEKPKKKEKVLYTAMPIAGITSMPSLRPRPQLPRLLRIPNSTMLRKSYDVITLDDEAMESSAQRKAERAGGVSISAIPGVGSSFVPAAPPSFGSPLVSIAPAPATTAQAPMAPVLLRAFSLRPPGASGSHQLIFPSSSAHAATRIIFSNAAGRMQTATIATNPRARGGFLRSSSGLTVIAAGGGMSKLQPRMTPVPIVRFPAPGMITTTTTVVPPFVRPISTSAGIPKIVVRTFKPPQVTDQVKE